MYFDAEELISRGECETIEFKKTTALLREGIKTLCAFANTHGGFLFFGIKDNGDILGQQISDETIKNIANEIKLNTDPKIYPSIEKIIINNKSCVMVTVEESPLKPHLAYGRPYIRVGSASQQLDRNQYEYMIQQRYNGYGFDFQTIKEASIRDINVEAVYQFIETANSIRSLNESLLLDPEILLEKLDLIKDGLLTKASILLFGNKTEQFFSNHFEIKCGKFPVEEGFDIAANEKEFKGNLIEIFYSTFNFVCESITKKTITQDIHQKEIWEFPLTVIREAIVNMIVHRDYRQGVKSTIEIRPQTIIFYNPAQLFSPIITIDNLKKVHPSRPGNKLIAKIFYLLGLFENWGGGTLKIINETINCGKPCPEFSFENDMFRLQLLR